MIFEHEIPEGSKLYFGNAARTKREIERIASDVLFESGYEEIATPLFSYHQHQSISDQRELVRVNDNNNNRMSLRADSTIDVVRIIDKRLGRNTSHKKWFYIQPVYRFPSYEHYQVGAEYLGEKNLGAVLNDAFKVFNKLELTPTLQLSNICIPQKVAKMLEMPLDDFRTINVQKFLDKKIDWLTKLVYIHTPEDLESAIEVAPEEIKEELQKLKELASQISYAKVVIAPLYYAKMLYYDELFFRVIDKNDVYARGGRYKNDELTSVGFAIYTDALIDKLSEE